MKRGRAAPGCTRQTLDDDRRSKSSPPPALPTICTCDVQEARRRTGRAAATRQRANPHRPVLGAQATAGRKFPMCLSPRCCDPIVPTRSSRYEQASLILISNVPVSSSSSVSVDPAVSIATIDHTIHHADLLSGLPPKSPNAQLNSSQIGGGRNQEWVAKNSSRVHSVDRVIFC